MDSQHELLSLPPSPISSDESTCCSTCDNDSSSPSRRSSKSPSLNLGSEGSIICDSEEEQDRASSPLSITSKLLADLESIREEDALSAGELHGPMLRLFLDTVKYFVARVLAVTIYDYNKVLCNGCQVSHPSQLQHTCLLGIPPFFLGTYYEALKNRVLTNSFTVAALKLLEKYDIRVSGEKIGQAGEAILQDLKDSENVMEILGNIEDDMVRGPTLKSEDLQEAVDFWGAGE